jgi:hypothetical protein
MEELKGCCRAAYTIMNDDYIKSLGPVWWLKGQEHHP